MILFVYENYVELFPGKINSAGSLSTIYLNNSTMDTDQPEIITNKTKRKI